MFQISTTQIESSILVDDGLPVIGPNTQVWVDAWQWVEKEEGVLELVFGKCVGTIQFIGLSPYHKEAKDGIQRAYIATETATDYILVEDLVLVDEVCDCTDCSRQYPQEMMCPECGYCLGCCDCTTEDADAIEDYHPSFMYLGRQFPECID